MLSFIAWDYIILFIKLLKWISIWVNEKILYESFIIPVLDKDVTLDGELIEFRLQNWLNILFLKLNWLLLIFWIVLFDLSLK
jgi:hypothetical protein